MDGQVLVEVRLLCKGLVAAWLIALKGSFSCVNSEVVEEVMPLPEKHVTPLVVAFQNFDVPLGAWVFVFEDSELPCFWYFLVNFDSAEVKLVACFYAYFCSIWDFVTNLFVGNFVFEYFARKFLLLVHEAHLAVASGHVHVFLDVYQLLM